MPEDKQIQEWEKEFDEIFDVGFHPCAKYVEGMKEFIHSLLKAQATATEKRCVKEKKHNVLINEMIAIVNTIDPEWADYHQDMIEEWQEDTIKHLKEKLL